MKRQLHLNLFIHSRGHHEASWRHPASSPLPLTDIRYYQDLAQRAEAALFDSIFLADQLALGDDVAQAARTWLEPITVLAALAVSTSRIGLIATASTTYTEPFNLARQFASIDHISNGRAAWNIVTSWLATAARNFGGAGQVSHADRYARGEEFMAVVKALWDSWADDAVVDDRAGGLYAQAGPHPADRPSRRFLPGGRAAQHAALPAGPAGAGAGGIVRHRPPLRRAACRGGVHRPHGEGDGAGILRRSEGAGGGRGAACPTQVLILPGPEPDDRRRPRPRRSAWRARSTSCPIPRSGASGCPAGSAGTISRICRSTARWSPEDFPDPRSVEAARSRTEVILNLVRRDKPTLRQLLASLAGARGHFTSPPARPSRSPT